MAHPLIAPDPASVPLPVRSASNDVPVPVRAGSDHVPAPVRCRPDVVPDCERLDVYRVAVEFQLLAASIGPGRRLGALRDQLDRASVSIVLNVAEGSGRFAPADKAHFYLIARGSAMECLAALALLQARSLVSPELYRRSRPLLTRIVAMLTRLAAAMQKRMTTRKV
jgi:four helix bundle protein